MAYRPPSVLLAAILLCTAACVEDPSQAGDPADFSDVSPEETVTITLGTQGGIVRHPLATVEVPANALGNRPITLTVGPASDDLSDYDVIGPAVRVSTDDASTELPLRVRLTAPDARSPKGVKVWSTFEGGGYTAHQELSPLPGATGSTAERLDPESLTVAIEHDATLFFARSGVSTGMLDMEPASASLLFLVSDGPNMTEKHTALIEELGTLVDDLHASTLDYRVGISSVDCSLDSTCGLLLEGDGLRWIDRTTTSPVMPLQEAIESIPIEDFDDEGRDRSFLAFEGAFSSTFDNVQSTFLDPTGQLDVVFFSARNERTEGTQHDPEDMADLLGDLVDDPADARFHAITGQYAGMCEGVNGPSRKGPRYHDAASITGGTIHLICHDFAPALRTIVAGLRATECTPLPFPGHAFSVDVSMHPSGAPLPEDMYAYDAQGQCLTVYQSAWINYPHEEGIIVTYQIHED